MTFQKWMWGLVGFSIALALLLSIAYLFELCTSACQDGHNWRILGIPFEYFGIAVFSGLSILYLLSFKAPALKLPIGLALVASLGAEIYFITIQATKMAAFCPVCLAIAGSVFIGTTAFILGRFYTMRSFFLTFPALFVGLFVAIFGVAKIDKLQAAQGTLEESLAFGDKQSPIVIYLFTDWACPACRKLEPKLKELLAATAPKARFYFIDHAIHPETLNFVPYNLSFIIHNKDKYIEIRDILTKISEETGAPDQKQVENAVSKAHITYSQLNFADVALAIRFYKELGEKYKVQGTPTMVIINTQTKKGKRLVGTDEITVDQTINAINQLIAQHGK